MENYEIESKEQDVNDNLDKREKITTKDNYKRNKIILIVIAALLMLVKILSAALDPYFTKLEYKNIIEELKDMDDGEMHNIAHMYKIVKKASVYQIDVDEFYENSIIKDVENLNGNWAMRSAVSNGKVNSFYKLEDVVFKDGVRCKGYQKIEADICYKDGVFYLGEKHTDKEYEIISEYEGSSGDTLIIEKVFQVSDSNEYDKWQFHCSKRLN